MTAVDGFCRFTKKLFTRVRIGVDKQQPVAARLRRAGIAGARDLVHWLEHHFRAGRACDLRRPVGRVVIANDEFGII